MRKIFVLILLAASTAVLADDAQPTCYKAAKKCVVTAEVPKGMLPPRWLLNKVTPAQYDTLAALNRLCNVDYSMLKGYNVTPQMVSSVIAQAREQLHKAVDSVNEATPGVGWRAIMSKTIKPWREMVEKGVRTVEYMVYSSIDGYDVHLLLRAKLQRAGKKGNWCSVSYELVPYSIQNIPVEVSHALVSQQGGVPVDSIEIGSDVQKRGYAVSATLRFTDPLGNKHEEFASVSIHLK